MSGIDITQRLFLPDSSSRILVDPTAPLALSLFERNELLFDADSSRTSPWEIQFNRVVLLQYSGEGAVTLGAFHEFLKTQEQFQLLGARSWLALKAACNPDFRYMLKYNGIGLHFGAQVTQQGRSATLNTYYRYNKNSISWRASFDKVPLRPKAGFLALPREG